MTRSTAPGSGLEAMAIGAAGLATTLAGALFAGAWLSARVVGGDLEANPGTWAGAFGGLVSDPGDPATAWGPQGHGLPGPILYWVCTAIAVAVAAALVTLAARLWRSTGRVSEERFGVSTDARIARARDVRTLKVPSSVPPTGRFLLGRMVGGPLLATEDRERHPMRGRAAQRQGSRGSVAILGPTQSYKTVTLSSGIAGWDGPVIALSVKADLYRVTAAARASRGELAVFDPGSSTKLPTARWTPLRGVDTASGALRAGRSLAAAIPRNGVTGGDYWAQQGETFVSAYMAVAGLSERLADVEPLTIQRLTAWSFTGAGITDPTINTLVKAGLQSSDLETSLLAQAAAMKLMALHEGDPRIRDSIYATARLAFEAWSEPSVAHSASLDPRATYDGDEIWEHRPRFIDLEWLMGEADDGRANTLYLVAPDTEFRRLSPVLGGLLGDLREQIHAWDIEGRRLDKPLLFVIDEAAQLELSWLPEEVSTIAGLGGMFVTCWQSKAQIDHRYGTLSDAVLGGHRSKIVLAGCDDPATVTWLGKVAGPVQVTRRGTSSDSRGGQSVSEHVQTEQLVDSHLIRQLVPGEGLLVHSTLPLIHLRSVRWWKDKTLSRAMATDGDGELVVSTTGTCPLSGEAASSEHTSVDRSALAESTRHLPGPATPKPRPRSPAPASAPTPSASLPPSQSGVKPEPSGEPGPPAGDDEPGPAPERSATPGPKPPPASGGGPASRSSRPSRGRGSRDGDGGEQLPLIPLGGGRNKTMVRCERCHGWLQPGEGQDLGVGGRARFVCGEGCEGGEGGEAQEAHGEPGR